MGEPDPRDDGLVARAALPALGTSAITLAFALTGCTPAGSAPSVDPAIAKPAAEHYAAYLDLRWKQLLTEYPDAERPTAHFISYYTDTTADPILSSCFTAAGVPFELLATADGHSEPAENPGFQEEAIAAFGCHVAHPRLPTALPPVEKIDALYDSLVGTMATCYESHGAINTPPPPRDQFIATWPNEDWIPGLGGAPSSAQFQAAIDNCPRPTHADEMVSEQMIFGTTMVVGTSESVRPQPSGNGLLDAE